MSLRVVVVGGSGQIGRPLVTDILVRGQRVIPARASTLGYEFGFPALDAALRDMLGQADRPIAVAR